MLKMIHDLDEMLYPTYPDATNIMCSTAARVAVEDCGLSASVAYARELIDMAIAHKKADWMHYLVAEGVDADHFHAVYHQKLDHKLITPYPNLSRYFNELGSEADHVLLTHSAGEWAERVLKHINLSQWFPEDRILSWEKYKAPKSTSFNGFKMAMERLNTKSRGEVVFADDSASNLITAHKMGITTVWVSHNRPVPMHVASHIDHVVESIEVFMRDQVDLLRKSAPNPLP